jgi:DNA-binding NtrC family response regulator
MQEKRQLLFVDDEPLILQSLSLLFSDYVVHTAESATAALEILKSNSIAVIISDQRMPQMSGIDFLRLAKDLSPNSIRILMTGYADLQAVIDSVNVGEIFRYINKPWNADKLRETVRFACSVALQRASLSSEKPMPKHIPALQLTSDERCEHELLFVDANQKHLEQFKSFFEPKYETHISSSASEAFALIPKKNIAVVVCDSNLAEVDGADFLIAVKAKFPEVVTVLMTASNDAKLAVKMINEGQVYRYLVKPFSRESLRLTIESAIINYKLLKQNPTANLKLMENDVFRSGDSSARSVESMLAALRASAAVKAMY